MDKIPLVAVVGPTASGKTALGVAIAKKYGGEVVSADSMQIYQGMHIATAKPSKEEMQGITHHMMDFLAPSQSYSVALYADRARNTVEDIHRRGKLPILTGGTGLYVSTVLNNIMLADESGNEELRQTLLKRLETEGIKILLDELASFDPQSAQRLAGMKNGKRIIRAIEIYKTTGTTMTKHLEYSRQVPPPYIDLRIGLKCADRENLYRRINQRVDAMLSQGLLKETEEFLQGDYGQTAAMAIGYKELKPYFIGKVSLEEAVEKLKRETRRYAKRQLTWFLRDDKIHWIDIDTADSKEEIFNLAYGLIEQSGIIK